MLFFQIRLRHGNNKIINDNIQRHLPVFHWWALWWQVLHKVVWEEMTCFIYLSPHHTRSSCSHCCVHSDFFLLLNWGTCWCARIKYYIYVVAFYSIANLPYYLLLVLISSWSMFAVSFCIMNELPNKMSKNPQYSIKNLFLSLDIREHVPLNFVVFINFRICFSLELSVYSLLHTH